MSRDSHPRHRIFVYGTLKRGGTNHHWLQGQTFVAPAQTVPGFRMYALDGYPGLVAAPDDRNGVTGEIWEVDGRCLAALDELEGIAEGLYRRVPIPLADAPPGEVVEAYLYARSVEGRAALGPTWPV